MTSDNLPAVPETRALAPVAVSDTDSWVEIMRPVIALADRICDTEFVPRGLRGSAPATAAAMLYGREIGLPPMTALGSTHVIEGKPGISAEIMRALVFAAGHEIEFGTCTSAQAQLRGRRRGQENWTVVEWSLDQARAAGLLNKQNWSKYPADQLVARATTTLCRRLFPDVIHGFSSLEELGDMDEDDAPDAAPAGPTTRVSRAGKKTAAKKTTPTPREERPALASGPPLPGEEGYDAPGPVGGSEEQGAASSAPDTDDEAASGQVAGGAVPTQTSGEGGGAGFEQAPSSDADKSSGGEGKGEAPEPPGGSKDRGPRLLNRAQQRGIEASLTALGVDNDRDERHLIAGTILGREITSMSRVTFDEASTLMDTFGRVKDKAQLNTLLDEFQTGQS